MKLILFLFQADLINSKFKLYTCKILKYNNLIQGKKVAQCQYRDSQKKSSPLTSVQSFRRDTVVSVGLILIVFSSIRLFREFPPRGKKGDKGIRQRNFNHMREDTE